MITDKRLKEAKSHLDASNRLIQSSRDHMSLSNTHLEEAKILQSKALRERNLAKIILDEVEADSA